MRRIHFVGIVTLFLLVSLSVFVVYLVFKNGGIVKDILAPTAVDVKSPQLVQKMDQTKENKKFNSISSHVAGGDDKYGGTMVQGVLVNVTNKEMPILTTYGVELGRAIVSLELAYLTPKKEVKTIYLVLALKTPDGSMYSLSTVPSEMTETQGMVNYYQGKIGTTVYGNFHTDTNKVIDAMQAAQKSPQEVERSKKVFDVLRTYETSWSGELDQFISTGEAGGMQFLFPLLYLSRSFDPKFGTFTVSDMTK